MDVRFGPKRRLSAEELMLSNCGAGENSWDSLGLKIDLTIPKGNQPWIFIEGVMLKLKLQYFGHLMRRADSLKTTLVLGKIEGKRRRWQRIRWLNNWLKEREFEQTPRDTEGQGSLVNGSLWSNKELDRTKKLNNSKFLSSVCLSLIILSFLCLLSLLTANSSHLGYIDKIIVILTFSNQPK